MRLLCASMLLLACSDKGPTDTSDNSVPPETDTDTDADADADADTDSDTDTDTDTDTEAYRHTITVDGETTDYVAVNESFGTTSGAPTSTFVAWDDTNLYVAMHHVDVASGGPEHWAVLTLGNGGAGSTTGVTHGGQTPELAFEATHVVRWKADDSYDALLTWDGSDWVETPDWLGTSGSEKAEGEPNQVIELAIPLAEVGAVDELLFHTAWVYEGAGSESTYAGTPKTSFTNGFDPDYGSFFRFDLHGTKYPAQYVPEAAPPGPTGDTGTSSSTGATADTGAAPWRATVTVDGDGSDFPAGTDFTTSGGTLTRIAWDDTNLYLAVEHPDVQAGGNEHWVLVYVGDGTGGTTTGVQMGTQQPVLPFGAKHLVRWKADDSYDSLVSWDGVQWVDTPSWLGTAGSAKAEDEALQTLELALPLSALGLTGTIDLHVGWIYEGAGFESTYGATPSGSIAEGAFDPDYTEHWRFDLAGSTAPDTYAPLP